MPYAYKMKNDNRIVWPEFEDEAIWRAVQQKFRDREWNVGWAFGQPIDVDALGTVRVRITSSHKKLDPMFPLKMRWAVAERIRLLIETIEPGVHQFIPTEITLKDGSMPQGPFYLVNICNRITAVDRANTVMTKSSYGEGLIASGESDRIFLREADIRNKALWIDADIHGWEFMCEALHDELQTSGCTRFVFNKVELIEGRQP